MSAIITRRLTLGGLASLALATPALAQMDPLQARAARNRAQQKELTQANQVETGAKAYGPSIDAMGGAYPNRALQSAVQRVAAPIFAVSTHKEFAYEITVVDSNEPNAWVLPGGKVGLNKGLLRYVDNEDELAAVIAHEMGHAEFSHLVDEQKGKKAVGAALAIASALGAGSSDNDFSVGVGLAGLDVGLLALVTSNYSRDHEREADQHIKTVFARTGHSVARGAGVYRTLLQLIPESSKGRTSLFAGHPETRERIAALSTPGEPPPPKTSAAFTEVKAVFPTRKTYLRS